ncbi:MAG: transposase [Desulfocapsa sp.]|uniref:Transposase n=1 Tax=Desulfotalea psychrophila TaxID=84980 RepID=A0ABS3AV89_9BACT|nr:transposase [Desulfocapsa sp.]MBN4068686.1 transposase [Desulfotalea psychrophila]
MTCTRTAISSSIEKATTGLEKKTATGSLGLGPFQTNAIPLEIMNPARPDMFVPCVSKYKLQVPKNCPEKWVVDCKNVGNGDKALIYLGRYLYRGVIQEKDILKCENGCVTFRYTESKTKTVQIKTVKGEHFLWLLMQQKNDTTITAYPQIQSGEDV